MELICIEGYQNTGKTTLSRMLQDSLASDNYATMLFDQPDNVLDLDPLGYYECLPDVIDKAEDDYVILDTCWLTEAYHRANATKHTPQITYQQVLDLYDELQLIGVTRITYLVLGRPWAKQLPDHQSDQVLMRGYGSLVDRYFGCDSYNKYLVNSDFAQFCYSINPDFTQLVSVSNTGTEEDLLECKQTILF